MLIYKILQCNNWYSPRYRFKFTHLFLVCDVLKLVTYIPDKHKRLINLFSQNPPQDYSVEFSKDCSGCLAPDIQAGHLYLRKRERWTSYNITLYIVTLTLTLEALTIFAETMKIKGSFSIRSHHKCLSKGGYITYLILVSSC